MSPRASLVPPATNRFLELLPRTVRQRLLAACETVHLVESNVLYERGDRIHHVYFPIDSFPSMITPVDAHAGFEVDMAGSEGMVGISLALGVAIAPQRALVQGSGSAFRMSATAFGREHARSPSLRKLLDRYLHVVLSQMAQVSACTRSTCSNHVSRDGC